MMTPVPPLEPNEPASRPYDVVVIGGGASGMVAAITAARLGRNALLCEKSPSLGRKLLASGGQRCNLSNTLETDAFMERWGRDGRFVGPALAELGGPKLREFFHEIGVQTVVHDGFRVWPETRKSSTVLKGLVDELDRLQVDVATGCEVESACHQDGTFHLELASGERFRSQHLIIATGGLALPKSGAAGGGYAFASSFGHRIVTPTPAGVPLLTKEAWPARLTAHTIGKARIQVAIKKYSKLVANGDLIFMKNGIRGPVVLDLSREVPPLLEKLDEIPVELNLFRGRDQEDWQGIFKAWRREPDAPLTERMSELMPLEVAEVLCELADVDTTITLHALKGGPRDQLIRVLVRTPLTITGTTGFDGAFVTRGGVHLKEVRPETLESKLQPGLFLCGEVLNLDGPCGGFNLQWAFASGFLAACGKTAAVKA